MHEGSLVVSKDGCCSFKDFRGVGGPAEPRREASVHAGEVSEGSWTGVSPGQQHREAE